MNNQKEESCGYCYHRRDIQPVNKNVLYIDDANRQPSFSSSITHRTRLPTRSGPYLGVL